MAFDPDAYLSESDGFNPDDYLSEQPKTLAEKTLGLTKDVGSYPMGLPANPYRIAPPILSKDVIGSYYELMPRMEKGSAIVKSAKSEAIGNVLRQQRVTDTPTEEG